MIPIGTFYWFCRFVTLESRSFWEIFNWLCLSPHKPREIKWTSQTVHIILSQGVLKTYVCLAFLNNESYQICSSNLKHVVVDLRLRLLLFSLLVFTSKYFTRFLEPATNDIESYWELEYSKIYFIPLTHFRLVPCPGQQFWAFLLNFFKRIPCTFISFYLCMRKEHFLSYIIV